MSGPTVFLPSGNSLTAALLALSLLTAGNTAGTPAVISNQTVYLAGGNNITLSQDANSITIIGPSLTGGAGSQTAGISNLGNTSGTSGVASGSNIALYLAGGNNVTLSQSVNGASATITISAPNQTAESNTLGMSNLGNTSGTSGVISGNQLALFLAGGNNVTISQSINGASATLTFSAPNQTAESNTIGISNLGNTSGTSGVASGAQVRILLAGGNNITLSQSLNGASATITISAPNQTAESNTLGMSNLGNTSGTSGVISGNQLALYLAGGNNVTLSQSINGASGTITISAPNQTAESNTIGISNLGNTSGTSGVASGAQIRILLAGGNNVTLSQSLNGASATITISAFNQTVESQSFGMSNLGNTSGTSGIASGGQVQFLLAGGNNITLSQSINGASGTITISAPNQTAASNTLGISNLGNTSGTSGVISGNQLRLILAGGNNITLSQSVNGSSATITISGAAGAGGGSTFSEWMNGAWSGNVANASNTTRIAIGGASTTSIYAVTIPYALTATVLNQIITLQSSNSSANNSSRGWSLSAYVGLYTRNGSVLSLLTSGSTAFTTTVSSNGWTSQGSADAQIMGIPINVNIPAGLYYLAVAYLTTSTRTNIYGNVGRIDAVPHFVIQNSTGGNITLTNYFPGAYMAPSLWGAASTRVNAANGHGFITATNSTSISDSIAISAVRTFVLDARDNIPQIALQLVNSSVAQT